VWHKLDHPNVTKVDSNELYFLPNPWLSIHITMIYLFGCNSVHRCFNG
jgi:hypothetical protein